ncbi:MAG TPA: PTS sugar transporter subunit IIA [Sumerlaeia bacterium]|nr:PTS sugar transporter subunit IIA [Sumerlaeia bacterium]
MPLFQPHCLAFLDRFDPLLTLAFVLIFGALGGAAAKGLKIPSLTGNILAGVLIGPVLHLVKGEQTISMLSPLFTFAMCMIAVTIGGHLSYRRIHNALRRIALIGACEVAFTSVLVTLALLVSTGDWPMSLLLGALAIETAAATIMHIVRESRAKGTFVKTVLSTVAIDNILAIVAFAVVTTIVGIGAETGLSGLRAAEAWLPLAWRLLGAVAMGLAIGRVTEFCITLPQFHGFSIAFVSVLVSAGLSGPAGVSPLMTSLVFGVYMANRSRKTESQLNALEPITPILFVGFFTLAGMTLHWRSLAGIGLPGVCYIGARVLGKTAGAAAGGFLARASRRIWQNVGLALAPHAGLAVALTVLLQADTRLPADLRTGVSTIVLAAVVVNEIIGPFLARLALRRAREENKDRRRLIEFLQEEFIQTNLKAANKWDAIRELCDFLIRTHRVEHVAPDDLYQTVVDRERESSTAIGKGAALPHGMLDEGPAIQGVLGISRQGVDWEGAPDGQPVRIIMLIATPTDHESQHLRVLAAMAAMISHEAIRSRVLDAPTANDVWEIIEDEETPDYNYFIDD